MKRILILSIVVFLMACSGNGEVAKEEWGEPKEKITREETFVYLEKLLEQDADLTEIRTEDEALGVSEEIGSTAKEVSRELKRDYEKDRHAVEDLLKLTETLEGLAQDVEDDNLHLMGAYGQDVGKHIRNISIEYLDGDLPGKYAEVVGADNIYDLE